jgi:GNAT superfamily N-acetyltransferase
MSWQMPDIKFFSAPYEKYRQDLMTLRNANRETIRNRPYFDWRYLGRPNGSEPIVILAENGDGRKIGAFTVTPHHYLINNKVHLLGKLGDISVAKEWRGHGVATGMLEYLSECRETKNLTGYTALPNQDAARSLKKTGWQVASKTDRYIKIIRFGEKFRQKFQLRNIPDAFFLPVNYAMKLFSFEAYVREPIDCRGELVATFDERFDALWSSLNKENLVLGFRTREYLNWRYSKHPQVKYQIFTLASDTRLCGYIVFHTNQDQCHIDDILCLNQNSYPTHLLAIFLKYIIKSAIASSISIRLSPKASSLFRLSKFGFMKRADDRAFMLKPILAISNAHEWYLTVGDKDS